MQGAPRDEHTITQKVAGKRLTSRYRWFESAPLCHGKDGRFINWIGVTVTDAKGKVTDVNVFVTSLPVTRESVAGLGACARLRWKVQNESINVLKNDGYNLEHNFGHGKQNLAMMFAAMNLLSFACHTIRDCLEQLWIDARTATRARKRFFQHIKTITVYLVFPDWESLMQALINAQPPRMLKP